MGGAGLAIVFWPSTANGYGFWFWVWASGLCAWWLSFWGQVETTTEDRADRPRADWPVLLGLIAAALSLRLPMLEQWPEYIHRDEIMALRPYVHQLLNGQAPNIFSDMPWHNSPWMQLALQAPAAFLFGYTVFACRVTSAVMSVVVLVGVYMLALRACGRRAALFSFLVLLFTWCFFDHSRTGTPNVQPPFFGVLTLWLCVRALQDRRPSSAVLAGLILGIGLGSYAPVRTVPLTLMAWCVTLVLVIDVPSAFVLWRDRRRTGGTARTLYRLWGPVRALIQPHLAYFCLAGISTVLAFAPVLRMEASRPEDRRFLSKAREVTLVSAERREDLARRTRTESVLGVVVSQLYNRTWPMIWHSWDLRHPLQNYFWDPKRPGAEAFTAYGVQTRLPVFDRTSVLLCGIGLFWSLWALRRNVAVGWIVWLVLITLVLTLGITDRPNAAYRLCAAFPAAAVAAGVALELLWRGLAWLADRLGRWAAVLPLVVVSGLLAVIAVENYRLLIGHYNEDQRRSQWDSAITRYYMKRGTGPIYYLMLGTRRTKHVPGFEYLPWPDRQFRNMGNPQDWIGVPGAMQTNRDAVIVVRPRLAAWRDYLRQRYPLARTVPLANLQGELSGFAVEIPAVQLDAPEPPDESYGLYARYYRSNNWSGPVVMERVDPLPSFFSGPEHRRPRSESVEWNATLVTPLPGEYQFRLSLSRDYGAQATVQIGGTVLTRDMQTVRITLDNTTPVRIRYKNDDNDASAGYWLEWSPPGRDDFTLVPGRRFLPSRP